ncbi:MAG: SNF2-related protein [Planctomycetota bacterium]
MKAAEFIADPVEQEKMRRERALAEPYRVEERTVGPTGVRIRVVSPSLRRYDVEVRDPARAVNACTCPDFAVNLLGTCKHLEAVFRRHRTKWSEDLPDRGGIVYLRRTGTSAVAFHAFGRLTERAASVRDAWFGPEGTLRDLGSSESLLAACEQAGVAVGAEVLVHLAAERERLDWEAAADRLCVEVDERGRGLLSVPLYPFQAEGVRFLVRRRRAVLADEMGLGKTIQAIAAARLLSRAGLVSRVLVVCPASLKHQWYGEVKRFTEAEARVVSGGPRQRQETYRQGPLWTVANYEQIFHDREFLQDAAVGWDLVILDEAQRIKNWRAKTSDAIKDLRGRCKFAFVLTGTPLENNLEELFSVCQFVDPNVLGPIWKFYERHFQLDDHGHTRGYRRLDELRARIAPVLLRRTKEEVQLQLPPLVSNTFYLQMTPNQRDAHDNWMKAATILYKIMERRPLLPKEEERLMMDLLLARRACDDSTMGHGDPSPSPKIDELGKIVDELVVEGGRKAILFSEWKDMLDLVSRNLAQKKIGHAYLHGGVPSQHRGRLIERFREDRACRVFLSTEAGGQGLNLQAASVVVHLDLPWNPAKLAQRTARAHRMGQRETVQVIHLVAQNSIEHRMEELLAGKRGLFASVFGRKATETEWKRPASGGPAKELLRLMVTEQEWRDGGGAQTPERVERTRSFEEALAAALGTKEVHLFRMPRAVDGVTSVLSLGKDVPKAQDVVSRVASTWGEPVPRVVPQEILEAFRRLCPAVAEPAVAVTRPPGVRVAPAAPSAAQSSAPDGPQTPAPVELAVVKAAGPRTSPAPSDADVPRALSAARCLASSGYVAEAAVQAGRAVVEALSTLLARHGVEVPAPHLVPLAVRRDLAPKEAIARPLLDRALAAVACAQSCDGTSLDDATARSLLAEAEEVVAELGRS